MTTTENRFALQREPAESKLSDIEVFRGASSAKEVCEQVEHQTETDVSSIFDAAHRYIDAGIHVFPLNGNKEPIVKAWNDRDFTADEISQSGAKGIGTCPGRWLSQVAIFDLDGPEARESWGSCQFDIGPLPETYSVKTGRTDGGEHYYYRMPDDLYVKSNA